MNYSIESKTINYLQIKWSHKVKFDMSNLWINYPNNSDYHWFFFWLGRCGFWLRVQCGVTPWAGCNFSRESHVSFENRSVFSSHQRIHLDLLVNLMCVSCGKKPVHTVKTPLRGNGSNSLQNGQIQEKVHGDHWFPVWSNPIWKPLQPALLPTIWSFVSPVPNVSYEAKRGGAASSGMTG